MDKRTTRTALEGQIRKWEEIVAGTGYDLGVGNSPLCALFYDDACSECPVAEATGKPNCHGTPFRAWYKIHYPYPSLRRHPRFADTPKKKAIAQAELDFLISLRPKGAS
jgi:hypothetical protein